MAIEFLMAAAAAWAGMGNHDMCMRAAHDLPPGTALSRGDTVIVPCDPKAARAALRYDNAARAVIVMRAIPSGTYLGRIGLLPEAQVSAGAKLVLRSTSGPVTIEREVTALQPARGGGRVFVRDASGKVFAAPLALVSR